MKTMLLLAVAAALAGCATTPVPADKLARSQAAVKSAEELNAAAEPRAAVHLKLAQEGLAQGRDLMKDGDNKRATYVLLRAEADGEAALNIARERSARVEAQKAIESIQQSMAAMQQGGSGS